MNQLHAVETPPTTPLDQDRRMRSVLVDMQLLMYGNASRFDQNSGRQKPSGGHCPPGESQPLHTIWQQAYVLASYPDGREQVIADATDALIMARKRTEPIPEGETQEEWEVRVVKEGRDLSAKEAAVRFRTGTLNIVKVRRKMNCDPNTGHELNGELSARVLAERGMTARQISLVVGCSSGTAQYHVNRARRAA